MSPAPPSDKPDSPQAPYKAYKRPVLPFEREADPRRSGLAMATSGIELGAVVVGSFFGGQWLDNQWDTEPTMTIALTLLGVAGGMTLLIRQALRASRRGTEPKAAEPKAGDDQ